MHYNEFQAVKLARQLIENDEDDDDDDDGAGDDGLQIASNQSQPHATDSSEAADSVPPTGDSEDGHMLREDIL